MAGKQLSKAGALRGRTAAVIVIMCKRENKVRPRRGGYAQDRRRRAGARGETMRDSIRVAHSPLHKTTNELKAPFETLPPPSQPLEKGRDFFYTFGA